jgi:hypothetical protein
MRGTRPGPARGPERGAGGVGHGLQDAELVVLVGPLDFLVEAQGDLHLLRGDGLGAEADDDGALSAPSPTYSARGSVLKVITVTLPNCIGSAPESCATVEPVVAFCHIPAAMFTGRVMLLVARTATAALLPG